MHEMSEKTKNNNICFNAKTNNCCWYI